ncbi:MAG: hypothetical protein KAH93_00290 [Candidatus Aenigmarchaeota archaeon]|nr:hypothetical protein [Candidatus Aenigmarchaeota archaeon]
MSYQESLRVEDIHPIDYFLVRSEFRDALLDEDRTTAKNYMHYLAGAIENSDSIEKDFREYESAILGGAIDAICTIKPKNLQNNDKVFIIKEIMRAKSYNQTQTHKGFDPNFEKFYDGDTDKHVAEIFRTINYKPQVIEELTTTILEKDDALLINPENKDYGLSKEISKVYNLLFAKPFRKKDIHTQGKSVIIAMEQYALRNKLMEGTDDDSHNILMEGICDPTIERLAGFYKYIFKNDVVESETLKELFSENGYLNKQDRLIKNLF